MILKEQALAEACGCDAPSGRSSLVSIDEALTQITAQAQPVADTNSISLGSAKGRILAELVFSATMSPPFDNAAMDGYAVDAGLFEGEGPWSLPVAARLQAGAAPDSAIGSDAAIRIFTGAPVPPGFNAVIRQEDVARGPDHVHFSRKPLIGSNIRLAGEDLQTGDIVVPAGKKLGPREIAACAAAGVVSVRVRKRLRVGLLVTGDEVCVNGKSNHSADIHDVNGPMLSAMLNDPAIELIETVHRADCRTQTEDWLSAMALNADLIVTTGGLSVGEEDHVKPALCGLGGIIHFSGVAIKPGKPVSFGRLGRAHWLGLPGNPFAAFVTWQIFGNPLVRTLTGQSSSRIARTAIAARDIPRTGPRCEYRLGRVLGQDGLGRDVVDLDDVVHSARVGGLPAADGLVALPADQDPLPQGAMIIFHPFSNS